MIVTQAREVREVLDRFDDFSLGESIEPGMPWGNFLMTVDWRQQHAQERQLLQSAVDLTADPARLRAIVDARCQQQIAAAKGKGQIDVVSDLLEPVVVDIADKYFGIPPLAGSRETWLTPCAISPASSWPIRRLIRNHVPLALSHREKSPIWWWARFPAPPHRRDRLRLLRAALFSPASLDGWAVPAHRIGSTKTGYGVT